MFSSLTNWKLKRGDFVYREEILNPPLHLSFWTSPHYQSLTDRCPTDGGNKNMNVLLDRTKLRFLI